MKRVILLSTIMLLVAVSAYAVLDTNKAEIRILDSIQSIKRISKSARERATVEVNRIQDVVTAFTGVLDSGDKTKLQGLQTEVTAANVALQSLEDYITTNFSSVE